MKWHLPWYIGNKANIPQHNIIITTTICIALISLSILYSPDIHDTMIDIHVADWIKTIQNLYHYKIDHLDLTRDENNTYTNFFGKQGDKYQRNMTWESYEEIMQERTTFYQNQHITKPRAVPEKFIYMILWWLWASGLWIWLMYRRYSRFFRPFAYLLYALEKKEIWALSYDKVRQYYPHRKSLDHLDYLQHPVQNIWDHEYSLDINNPLSGKQTLKTQDQQERDAFLQDQISKIPKEIRTKIESEEMIHLNLQTKILTDTATIQNYEKYYLPYVACAHHHNKKIQWYVNGIPWDYFDHTPVVRFSNVELLKEALQTTWSDCQTTSNMADDATSLLYYAALPPLIQSDLSKNPTYHKEDDRWIIYTKKEEESQENKENEKNEGNQEHTKNHTN